ncbi:MAG: glycosyltransferase family 2 protein [Candidatus Methylomirabilis oxygeniifera]|uniref:Glycosyl transferase family 2 n=1 Tax=Methylomirabilis oxygeniifera TaxID=671143 RepID=D5MFI8_METO1|nr:MAG: glycosyltransferase family 2 protein [Candidatus Methylomirabilis oxyfera]CBE68519.1 Glycosyl transferase family 2 [Candidatus Methylomirabilis oxyfera]
MKLSVIIPVYNERDTVELILKRVEEAPYEKEIILVDDASTDGTREILTRVARDHRNQVRLILHQENCGKGAAIRTAIEHVTGDIVIIQDADLEYDPQDYPRLLQPILDSYADVVFGNRFHGGPHRVLYFWHYQGNRFLTTLCNMMTNLNLSDMEVGYKVFRAEVLQRLRLRSNRFGIEPELTVKTAKLGCRIYEVPIAYHGRTYAEGKKITWKDGLAALYFILRFRLFD